MGCTTRALHRTRNTNKLGVLVSSSMLQKNHNILTDACNDARRGTGGPSKYFSVVLEKLFLWLLIWNVPFGVFRVARPVKDRSCGIWCSGYSAQDPSIGNVLSGSWLGGGLLFVVFNSECLFSVRRRLRAFHWFFCSFGSFAWDLHLPYSVWVLVAGIFLWLGFFFWIWGFDRGNLVKKYICFDYILFIANITNFYLCGYQRCQLEFNAADFLSYYDIDLIVVLYKIQTHDWLLVIYLPILAVNWLIAEQICKGKQCLKFKCCYLLFWFYNLFTP